MNVVRPPKYPLCFLRWFCREDYLDEIEGDLIELFEKRAEKSPKKARRRFVWDVMKSFRLRNLKKRVITPNLFYNLSFRQSLRYIAREKGYSLLNFTSLAIGALFFILFAWYAVEESSFDSFHSNRTNIYRLAFGEYLDLGPYATTSYPIGPAVRKDFPEVQFMSRFGSNGRLTVRNGDAAFFETVNSADADFFKMFDFELLQGNPETVLEAPNSVVISETLARKYFKDEDPLGKKLTIGSSGNYDSQVTGVFRDVPSHSQLQFELVMSYSTLEKLYSWLSDLWQQMPGNYTYVALYPGTDVPGFEAKLDMIKQSYVSDIERGDYKLTVTPFADVHFQEGLNRELDTKGSRSSLLMFGVIALTVLLVSVFNFVNLISSRYLVRLREMGIRKVMGASRSGLVLQLLFQAFLVVAFSLIIACVLLVLFLPLFNDLTGKDFTPEWLLQKETVVTVVVLLAVCTLGAGIVPALGITGMTPVQSLKSNKVVEAGRWRAGKSLMLIFQYAVSVLLLVGSIIIFRQLQFVESSIEGSSEAGTLVIPLNSGLAEKFDLLKSELVRHPSVLDVGASSHVPGFYGDSWPVRLSPGSDPLQTENFVITGNYLDLMSYQIVAGRQLNESLASDKQAGFVVNETCARMLGFNSPESAIGQTIFFGSEELKEGKIIGIAKDFHFESFKEKIAPALFQFSPYDWMGYNFLVVQAKTSDVLEVISAIEEEVGKLDQQWVVDAKFFDEHFKKFHLEEIRQGKLSTVFAVVAIILSCLGQLGLLVNGTLSRRKEIAIRKVLGARVSQLWYLMTEGYVRLFVVALIFALPLAWYLSMKWLDSFAYHISPGPWPFLAATLVSGLILMTIVSVVTIRSAIANPVNSLMDE
ncbi:MAG: ABC transporter permease [Imperialibacter sp.]|uniref:ABC transporter permease n=1 Tax=Imperialibacter sp. TaxID=2038411 RepID=UPI003A8A957D